MSAVVPPSSSEQLPRRTWVALAVVLLGFTTIVLDSTIVNIALPSIQTELDFSDADLTWVVNAFLLTFGSLLLLGGRLGDLFGRKRVFLGGLALFMLASLLCGLAQSATMLVAGRLVQGAGGAIASAVVLALIVGEFRRPHDRQRALAGYTFTAVVGGSIGLLAGGVLVELLDWRWMFFVNLPVCVAALVLGQLLIDDNEGIGTEGGVDVLGSLLVTFALMAGVFAIVGTAEHGWLSTRTLGVAAVSAVLLVAFREREARVANPIVPLRIFALRALVRSSIARALGIVGLSAAFFFGTLFLRHVLHYGPLETGLAFLPLSLGTVVLTFGPGARLVRRLGPRRGIPLGFAATALAMGLLATLRADSSYAPVLLVAFALLGLAAGVMYPPLLALAMADVPREDAGLASGVVSVSFELSAALGLAFVATFASARTHALAHGGAAPLDALVGGYRVAFVLAAGCVLAGLVVAELLVREAAAPATATS